jgi:hypothetical protein
VSEGSIPENDQGNVEAVLDRVSFLKLSFVFPIYGLDLGKVRVSGTCVLKIHKTVVRRPFLTRKRTLSWLCFYDRIKRLLAIENVTKSEQH